MKSMVIAALHGYKRWISPVLPNACRYVPTCSEYAIESVERHGVLRGVAMATWRVLRCNPLGGYGYDPVTETSTHICEHCADMGHRPVEMGQRSI
jgi:putative membrane protein insertion efficiency factor